MSTPLVDIDANPRRPGFKPTKEGSKIPSPSRVQRSGSTGRRSPFSVSTTGSPCYTAMPPTFKAVTSPTPATTSRLPRKSTPTQSAFSKSYTYGTKPTTPRSTLSQSRGGHKQSATGAPPNSTSAKTTSMLSYNKPLPSPPVAQLVNPQSPPKAQRTLVDAEAGTPTEEEWPILRPENISSPKVSASPKSDGLPQRSASEGSALRRNGIPIHKSRATTPFSVNNGTPTQKGPSSAESNDTSHKKFRQMTEPRTFSSMNPYAKNFHAFSTNTEVAIDSPLAHKQRTLPTVSIPPRISSKRSSLPLPEKPRNESHAQSTPDTSRSVKPGSTKWPVLDATIENVLIEQKTTEQLRNHEQQHSSETAYDDLAFSSPAPATQSHYGSIDSISTWSLAAGSSLNDDSEVDYEGTVRVKRLTWHSSNPNSGPTLRISSDADAVLLGRDESIPAVPALPEHMLENVSQERSLGTLAGRVSKQVLVKMPSSSSSRSPTPSSAGTEGMESKPVKITPIRSMQPPRKPSTGDLSKKLTSPVTPVPMELVRDTEILSCSQTRPRTSFEILREMPPSPANSDTINQISDKYKQHSYEHGSYSTTPHTGVSSKAMQVLGADSNTTQSIRRKRLPMTWIMPRSATFTLKKEEAKRSKTSPSLISAERFSNRASACSTRSPSSASSNLVRSIPSQTGARRPGPSRLGTIEPVAQDFDSPCIDCSQESQVTEQNEADTVLKIKAKRSFRNMFLRRDVKTIPQTEEQDSKCSSVTGSTLAQHTRDSTNASKASIAKLSNTKAEVEQSVSVSTADDGMVNKEKNRQATLSALESGLLNVSSQPAPVAHYDTATVIHQILDRVTLMGVDAPDRLRGLEIAEAVLHAIECSKEAKKSTELARKHARNAELHAGRAGCELKRLEKLCEPGFDDGTMRAIKLLIMSTGLVEPSMATEKRDAC